MSYKIIRSASFNWVALAIQVVVGFFLTPFVVRRLGSDAYGVWTYLVSAIAFMSLLDLGLRGTVTRFVARDYARGDHDTVNVLVSTIFWFRAILSFVAFAAGAACADMIVSSLEMPESLYSDSRLAFLLLAAAFAIKFTTGVLRGVLAALHRFDLISIVSIAQTGTRAAGVVWLLNSGHGFLALAVLELAFVLVVAAVERLLLLAKYAEFRIVLRLPDRETIRQVVGYSFYAYVINVCIHLVYYTDNIVVGMTLTTAAVTSYAIGGGLIEYLRQIVSSLTVTFTPAASSMDARGQTDQLRSLLLQGTTGALLVALPIATALLVRGHTFIGIWMGPEYADASSEVLTVLLIAAIVSIANTTSGGIALGLGRHAIVAAWATGEAISNLVLSILLAKRFGLIGVAWGTVIPSLVIHLLLWPPYISRVVNVPMWSYLLTAWGRPALAAVPFGIASWAVDELWVPSNLFTFFAQIIATLPLFALGFVIFCRTEFLMVIRSKWVQERLPVSIGRRIMPQARES